MVVGVTGVVEEESVMEVALAVTVVVVVKALRSRIQASYAVADDT